MDLVIIDIVIIEDPFAEYMSNKDKKKIKKVGGKIEVKEIKRDEKKGAGQEIGKYLASGGGKREGEEVHVEERRVKKVKPGGFGNFDGW
jgi:hypothetical protein